MRYIWSLSPKVDWDTVLNAEVINEWKRVAVSLNDAYKIPFKRMVLSKDNEYGVHIYFVTVPKQLMGLLCMLVIMASLI